MVYMIQYSNAINYLIGCYDKLLNIIAMIYHIIGPSAWGIHFPYCRGKVQSPIDILYSKVQYNIKFQPLKISNFDKTISDDCILENNGHTIGVFIPELANKPSLYDYDGQVYECLGFHFHWGSIDSKGSETWLNNKQYPIEVRCY